MANVNMKTKSTIEKLSSAARRFMLALGLGFARVTCACFISFGVILVGSSATADEVARAEAWFNKIKSIKADFVQVASDGTSAEGTLLLKRPSQMKITYQNEGGGKGLQLITSKIWLHVDQPAEELVTSYPLSETPLSLILAATVSLRLDEHETQVIQTSEGVMKILIAKEEGEGAGQLFLEFSEKPFQLRRWVVVDAVGIKTSVTLFNLAFDAAIPNTAFKIPDYSPEN